MSRARSKRVVLFGCSWFFKVNVFLLLTSPLPLCSFWIQKAECISHKQGEPAGKWQGPDASSSVQWGGNQCLITPRTAEPTLVHTFLHTWTIFIFTSVSCMFLFWFKGSCLPKICLERQALFVVKHGLQDKKPSAGDIVLDLGNVLK